MNGRIADSWASVSFEKAAGPASLQTELPVRLMKPRIRCQMRTAPPSVLEQFGPS